jgi:putative oxidoreductase
VPTPGRLAISRQLVCPVAPLAFIVAVAIEVGGGSMLLSGYRVRLASLVMAVFSLATAFFFYRNFGVTKTK